MFLDYRSDKTLGFHHDNAEIKWKQPKKIKMKVTYPTGEYEDVSIEKEDRTITYKEQKRVTERLIYHPYSPIYIFSSDNPEFIFKDAEDGGEPFICLPAFVMYAREESAKWANWIKAGEYALDILTTASGVGNIIRFGRLYKVLQSGKSLVGSSKVFTRTLTVTSGATGAAEISAGSVNILLKLTGLEDTALGQEISKYLFYFEMATNLAQLPTELFAKMQKSAKKIVAKEEVIRKKIDDIVIEDGSKKRKLTEAEKGKFWDELYEVAELDLMATRKIGNLGGKVATEKQIRQLRGLLKQKGVDLILEGDIKNALNQFKPIVINGNKFDKPNDLFRFMKDNDFVGGFNAETKQFILPRKYNFEKKIYENPTEIVIFHEMKHLEHFEEVGEIAYSKLNKLQKETYVWNKIISERGKWTQAELKESLRYIDDVRDEFNLKPITIK